jgi:hypothetical protein
MPNELPKALTNWEREELLRAVPAYTERKRALALIDALTALTALMAEQIVVDGRRIAELERERDGARDRMTIAECENAECEQLLESKMRQRDDAESKLAAANALLRIVYECGTPLPLEVLRPIAAHLSDQPAAPARTETQRYAVRGQEMVINVATDRGVCQAYSPEFAVQIAEALNSAPTRTEANMLTPDAAWDVLSDYVDVPDRDQHALFAALQERARRGAK